MESNGQHERFMRMAIEDALVAAKEGNTAVAAVIVRGEEVLSVAHATQQTLKNPCHHAEVNAIGKACERVNSADLTGATLYCTLEPCPMCAWAIWVAKIRRVVIGSRYSDLGRTDLGDYTFERFMAMMKQDIELIPDVLKQECVSFRLEWMRRTGRIV